MVSLEKSTKKMLKMFNKYKIDEIDYSMSFPYNMKGIQEISESNLNEYNNLFKEHSLKIESDTEELNHYVVSKL